MFLIKDRRLGMDNYVFTQTDPRTEGYLGDVTDNVTLDYDMNAIHLWPKGETRPNPRLGQDPTNLTHYKVFKSPEELGQAGFKLVHTNTPFVVYSWGDYRKTYYPMPEEYANSMTPDEWFDFLEEADVASKIRKKLNKVENPKKDSKPDEIAEWVAKRHMDSDGAISQVWFLPSESPTDELRLLEVSDRYVGDESDIRPFPIRLDVEGLNYKLLVADVSGAGLERVKSDPTKYLPQGWQVKDALIWGRRGRQQ